jgi:branched-chain amino acid transport system ATP-binding protein
VIFFEGKDITRVPAHTRVNMGLVQVPEGGRLFAQMSVLENLMLGGYTKDAWKKRNESLEKVYKIFPVLKERQNQPAHTLSGGERRMVAIGRGLMADSKLLMVDEPSLGLAPTLTTEVYRKMREINQLGVTLLLVEQNVKHVRGICNRAYLIENGRVFCEGSVDDVIEEGREVFLGK